MKVLIVSDTHKRNENLFRVIDREKPFDLMVHCGDSECNEVSFQEHSGCLVEMVAGNNDFFYDLTAEKEFYIGNYRVWLTHGHYYYVAMGLERLKAEAVERGVDIVMFGHTHKPTIDMSDGVMAINPGSLSYPRQENRRPSYIVMTIDKHENLDFTLHYVDE